MQIPTNRERLTWSSIQAGDGYGTLTPRRRFLCDNRQSNSTNSVTACIAERETDVHVQLISATAKIHSRSTPLISDERYRRVAGKVDPVRQVLLRISLRRERLLIEHLRFGKWRRREYNTGYELGYCTG